MNKDSIQQTKWRKVEDKQQIGNWNKSKKLNVIIKNVASTWSYLLRSANSYVYGNQQK